MPHRKPSSPPASATIDDIIVVAQMASRLRRGGDLRRSMIRRIRNAIQNGEYENSLKLDIAAERVIDVLNHSEQPSADR